MIYQLPSIETVKKTILELAIPLKSRLGPALANQLGVILDENIFADHDMPGLPTSRMDGFALRAVDAFPGNILPILGSISAGQSSEQSLDVSGCYRIATGAPLPVGADCVVPFEDTLESHGEIQVLRSHYTIGSFVRKAGEEYHKGRLLLKSGTPLGPVEYGLLALAGRTSVKQFDTPKVAVISTGNEIIEPAMKPAMHQVRNSNGPMLMAQLCRAGTIPRFLGISPDCVQQMQSLVREGAAYDAMVFSGGASKGECDLVRNILLESGYEIVVPGVMMRPGKPFFCAKHTTTGKLAFGLPGNPVSAFVCMELFVRPAIQVLRGVPRDINKTTRTATLESPFQWSGDRPFVVPMKRNNRDKLIPCSMSGSADLLSISGADSLVILASSGSLSTDEKLDYLNLE